MNPETVMKMTREDPPHINSILLLWASHLKKVTTDFITSGRKNIFKGMNASTSIFILLKIATSLHQIEITTV